MYTQEDFKIADVAYANARKAIRDAIDFNKKMRLLSLANKNDKVATENYTASKKAHQDTLDNIQGIRAHYNEVKLDLYMQKDA